MLNRFQTIAADYPRQFWLLMGASFIDIVGNALVYPFFALYMTKHFGVSVAQAGTVFALYALAAVVGSTIGGAMADKIGRRPVIIFGLVTSAMGNMAFALVPEFWMLYIVACTAGVFQAVGEPATQAMIGDILPADKRADGFAIWRMLFNLAVVFGPMIGGLLAGASYLLLFSVDAATSLITAAIMFFTLEETRPATIDTPRESVSETFRGYAHVLRDRVFISFALITLTIWVVYFQMNTTLGVFLRDEQGLTEFNFGTIISINALLVVLLQLGITRRISRRGVPPMIVMAAGTVLYALGFSMYGYAGTYALFVLAMIIITFGEMLAIPTGQALAVRLAREDMRGRYMAVFSFSSAIASGSGTWLAGLVIGQWGFEWVWYLAGIIAALAAVALLRLHHRIGNSQRAAAIQPDSAHSDTAATKPI